MGGAAAIGKDFDKINNIPSTQEFIKFISREKSFRDNIFMLGHSQGAAQVLAAKIFLGDSKIALFGFTGSTLNKLASLTSNELQNIAAIRESEDPVIFAGKAPDEITPTLDQIKSRGIKYCPYKTNLSGFDTHKTAGNVMIALAIYEATGGVPAILPIEIDTKIIYKLIICTNMEFAEGLSLFP